jgi:hypothetical protein
MQQTEAELRIPEIAGNSAGSQINYLIRLMFIAHSHDGDPTMLYRAVPRRNSCKINEPRLSSASERSMVAARWTPFLVVRP